jgi:hypothetical protein
VQERLLALRAGPYRVCLPLTSVRQILDMGGAKASAPLDPRALGVMPVSLARVLGAEPTSDRPALLLLDGISGPLLLSACELGEVLDAAAIAPLPPTVTIRFPGLLRGTISHHGARLVLEPDVLAAVTDIRMLEIERAEAREQSA